MKTFLTGQILRKQQIMPEAYKLLLMRKSALRSGTDRRPHQAESICIKSAGAIQEKSPAHSL
jgi:hypothetical protein